MFGGADLMDFLVADGMNFEVAGTSVLIVDNPEETPSRWRFRVGDMPDTSANVNW